MFQLLLICVLLVRLALGQAATGNFWISPGPPGKAGDYSSNSVFQKGSVMTISWNTNFESVNIALWQDNNPNLEPIYNAVPGSGPGSEPWPVETNKDLSDGMAFFFTVFDANDKNNQFNSHYFNMTEARVSSSSSSSSTSTLSSSSSSSSTSSRTPSPTSTPTSTPSASPSSTPTPAAAAATSPAPTSTPTNATSSSSGLSTNASIGLGVGVGIGAALLFVILGFFLWKRFGKRGTQNGGNAAGMEYNASPPYGHAGYFAAAEKRGFVPPGASGQTSPPNYGAYGLQNELHAQHNIFEAQDSRQGSVHELADRRSVRRA